MPRNGRVDAGCSVWFSVKKGVYDSYNYVILDVRDTCAAVAWPDSNNQHLRNKNKRGKPMRHSVLTPGNFRSGIYGVTGLLLGLLLTACGGGDGSDVALGAGSITADVP